MSGSGGTLSRQESVYDSCKFMTKLCRRWVGSRDMGWEQRCGMGEVWEGSRDVDLCLLVFERSVSGKEDPS